MNVFVLDSCPKQAATLLFELDPVRARKQIVELCQMLAQGYSIPKADGTEYKQNKSIKNHPATKWVNDSNTNRQWCIRFLGALLKVYGKEHGCSNAYKVLVQELTDTQKTPQFGWHSKKVAQYEMHNNIFLAHRIYIKQKQFGMFKN